MTVVFVCTGNTCRSPMAQALLAAYAKSKGEDWQVESAGLGEGGERVSPYAEAVLTLHGLSASVKTSRRLDKELFDSADIIFAMTSRHALAIEQEFGKNVKTVAADMLVKTEFGDPWGKGLSAYEDVFSKLQAATPIFYQYAKKRV